MQDSTMIKVKLAKNIDEINLVNWKQSWFSNYPKNGGGWKKCNSDVPSVGPWTRRN